MIFLEEPIFQFQFSIQANFDFEPDLPIDLLDVAEISEIPILDSSPKKKYPNVAFPSFLPQPQHQLHTILSSYSLSSEGHVNFPFEDFFEICHVFQRMHNVSCLDLSSLSTVN